ncbi:hypothetical protein RSAG8_05494, partial [Rhizoctonia solani AG-8 WAC10335]
MVIRMVAVPTPRGLMTSTPAVATTSSQLWERRSRVLWRLFEARSPRIPSSSSAVKSTRPVTSTTTNSFTLNCTKTWKSLYTKPL